MELVLVMIEVKTSFPPLIILCRGEKLIWEGYVLSQVNALHLGLRLGGPANLSVDYPRSNRQRTLTQKHVSRHEPLSAFGVRAAPWLSSIVPECFADFELI